MAADPSVSPADTRSDESVRPGKEWDDWYSRHADHHPLGLCIAHPVGCNRGCLDDAPVLPVCVCGEINMRHCPVHGQDDAAADTIPPDDLREAAEYVVAESDTATAANMLRSAADLVDALLAERDTARREWESASADWIEWQQERLALLAVGERDKAEIAELLASEDQLAGELAEERTLTQSLIAAGERDRQHIARLTEALKGMLGLLDKHDSWCGHNADAPGDSIVNSAPNLARAVLADKEAAEPELRAEDLKIDTFSIALGSHYTVLVTHIPTGTVAASDPHRSELAAKDEALTRLRDKLRAAGEGDVPVSAAVSPAEPPEAIEGGTP